MKVAVLSESPVDETAIRILVDGILGRVTEIPGMPALRARGVAHVFSVLGKVLRYLHYQTDAEALVIVVDSDRKPAHAPAHDQRESGDDECRLCRIRKIIRQTKGDLRPVADRPVIKTAVGLAVPSIEAWYRCCIDPQANEAAYSRTELGHIPRLIKHLKRDVYGSERYSLELGTLRASEEARRLVGSLGEFETLFPNGFGALARDVRGWKELEDEHDDQPSSEAT